MNEGGIMAELLNVNYLAVFIASLSNMIIGSVWYSKGLFGKAWMELVEIDPDNISSPLIAMIVGYICGFFYSLFVAIIIHGFSLYDIGNILILATIISFGYGLYTFTNHHFEGKPVKLFIINFGNNFITTMTIALIIGLIK